MMKVLLKGPILTQSGYGHHARTVYRALKTREDLFEIFIHPITWGHTSWLWEDCEERREIDKLLQKTIGYTQAGGKFDMSLQVTIPNEWEKIAPINIGYTVGGMTIGFQDASTDNANMVKNAKDDTRTIGISVAF